MEVEKWDQLVSYVGMQLLYTVILCRQKMEVEKWDQLVRRHATVGQYIRRRKMEVEKWDQ